MSGATQASSRAERVWQGAAVAGLAVFTIHALATGGGAPDALYDHWLYNALILLGLAACVYRACAVAAERTAWIVFSAGVGAWALGEIFYDFVYAGDPPFPSVADGFYLAFYPLCYVALFLLVRSRLAGLWRSLWLDGLMAALASATVGASVLVEMVLRTTDGSASVVVTNLAYPVGDVLLLSGIVGVLALTNWHLDRTWLLLGVGLAASVTADAIYLFQVANNAYTEGTVLDAVWPASLLLLCSASWQPPQRHAITLEGRPLLATPLVCGVLALGVFLYDYFHRLNVLAVVLAGATLLTVMARTWLTFREKGDLLKLMWTQAITDPLTGLGNRRRLVADLDKALRLGDAAEPRILAVFDLDGFKRYNDTFGHPAGDALLTRLAASLASVCEPVGTSYRLGGDEFCVLAAVHGEDAETFLDATARALADEGEAFTVTSSFGAVFLPEETVVPNEALRLADQRLYAQKRERAERGNPHEMLLQALYEREPDLRPHVQGVAAMACAVGRVLGLSGDELDELRLAARLHDVGKLAIPDAVLQKPGPLDVDEWAFMKEHTVIGERILSASPALLDVGRIVRATHERWDGGGYPDGASGLGIPLAARIIAVCDAYSAMTSARPYRAPVEPAAAVAELWRCAGTQFDPEVVAVFCAEAALLSAGDDWGGLRAAGAA
ncbi:MAG TPA: HD domain-containing phosphohydrolase [Gaiellaceae bacterium]|nr:HD domain-containing phosphohydrolase [Gaiellaceae bacterium]